MKLGVNNARRIPCARSKHHPAHPDDEACDYCLPAIVADVDPDDDTDLVRMHDPFGAWAMLWP